MPTGTRKPAFAGLFYPAGAQELGQTIDRLLGAAPPAAGRPLGLVAPHAGYIYSGATAAAAYRLLMGAEDIHRVVLLGPAHRAHVQGEAAPAAEAFETPLGAIPLDRGTISELAALPSVEISDAAHRREHSLEVHLPFLQRTLGDFTLVPLVAGGATPSEVRELLSIVEDDPNTLIVVSTDLSHFHDYETARTKDRATAQAIESLDPDSIGPYEACGCRPLGGALLMARDRGLSLRRLDLRNSGDTAGDRARVVGYGAWALETSPIIGVRDQPWT